MKYFRSTCLRARVESSNLQFLGVRCKLDMTCFWTKTQITESFTNFEALKSLSKWPHSKWAWKGGIGLFNKEEFMTCQTMLGSPLFGEHETIILILNMPKQLLWDSLGVGLRACHSHSTWDLSRCHWHIVRPVKSSRSWVESSNRVEWTSVSKRYHANEKALFIKLSTSVA